MPGAGFTAVHWPDFWASVPIHRTVVAEPRCLPCLGISKGSASTGTRQLAAWGATRKVWVPGERRDYYEVVEDLGQLIRGSYNNIIKPKIRSSKERLASLKTCLDEDIKSGALPTEKEEMLRGRIQSLEKVHKRLFQFLPLAEKFIN